MTGFVLTEEEKQNLLQMALQTGCQFELKTAGGKKQKTKMEREGRRLDMISGCAATRMTMINVAFPGAPSAGLHLSPWWDASQPSQPCKYNKPVLVLSGRSITTKQRLQL